jgi:hypothetical protein
LKTPPVVAAALVTALVFAAPAAHAQSRHSEIDQSAPIWWVLTVGEYSMVIGSVVIGTAALIAGDSSGLNVGGLLSGVALVLGIGAGFESIEKKWDPRIAIAMHEGLWLGADLASLGMLVAGTALQWPLYGSIPLALALGLAGAAGGAAIGGLTIESDLEATLVYVAPLVSAGAVGLTWLATSTWVDPKIDPTTHALFATALWTSATLPLLAGAVLALAYGGGQDS